MVGPQISSQAGNYNQRWKYSDSFKLDRSTFTVEDTIGFITPDVGDREAGFVYPGDMLRIGQYAFSERLSDGIIINPQIPLTLRIERQEVCFDGERGFFYAPSQFMIIHLKTVHLRYCTLPLLSQMHLLSRFH